MGVINCSPESFYSGSYTPSKDVFSRACSLVELGADIIDVGARSTAPGAPPLTRSEEVARMERALSSLEGSGIRVSVDTMDPIVLETCLAYDISAVNDISGLLNPEYATLVAESGLPALLMASRRAVGDARTLEETHQALSMVETRAQASGVSEYILDPAIGLWQESRTMALDWELCRQFQGFSMYQRPLLAAVSRKSFLGGLVGKPPAGRLSASLAMATLLVCRGADMVRTHDVAETRDAILVAEQMRRQG
jgi:dihydropteroate synthase